MQKVRAESSTSSRRRIHWREQPWASIQVSVFAGQILVSTETCVPKRWVSHWVDGEEQATMSTEILRTIRLLKTILEIHSSVLSRLPTHVTNLCSADIIWDGTMISTNTTSSTPQLAMAYAAEKITRTISFQIDMKTMSSLPLPFGIQKQPISRVRWMWTSVTPTPMTSHRRNGVSQVSTARIIVRMILSTQILATMNSSITG